MSVTCGVASILIIGTLDITGTLYGNRTNYPVIVLAATLRGLPGPMPAPRASFGWQVLE